MVFLKYVNDGISKISFEGNNCILCGPFKGVFVHAIDLTKMEIYVVQNGMVEII